MASIRILLADDHQLLRQCLRTLLEQQEDMVVVGEAANGREAVNGAAMLRPDVVVMDIAMSCLNGVEATSQIRALPAPPAVIGLTGQTDERCLRRMLDAGATGYLLKGCDGASLIAAVRSVFRGERVIGVESKWTPPLSRSRQETGPRVERLSGREREVLQMIAEGVPTKQVAARLGLSVKTVETHRKHIVDKLGIDSVAGLTKFAIREGIVSLDT